MQSRKYELVAKFVAVIMLMALLPIPTNANASSIYDDFIVLDTDMTVRNADGSCVQDVAALYMSILSENAQFENKWHDSYLSTGAWAVSTYHPTDGQKWVGFNFVADDANNFLQFSSRYGEPVPGVSIANWSSATDGSFYIRIEKNQGECRYVVNNGFSAGQVSYKAGSPYDMRVVYSSFDITYPNGYEGSQIPNEYSLVDMDGDGLVAGSEAIQGTSDLIQDTDGDGLSDYIESEWHPSRVAMFCGDSSCTNHAYPNPTAKDLYVEVDWMKDPLTSKSYKPTATQLNYVTSAFAAQGIITHFDTGQYGGGNELPNYIKSLHFQKDLLNFDFYDYKNGTLTTPANFDADRYHIWRYMIAGYEYVDIPGSSGVSYFSDDDTFISSGLIEDNPGNDFSYTDLDYAIAGTILHELGHNLCLNDKVNDTLRPECYSPYIDTNSAPTTYNSVMNYSYQMSDLLDYSDGPNGTSDHADWSAVGLGFADFASRDQGDQVSAGKGGLRVGITRSQAKQLRKENRIFTRVDKSKRSFKRQLFEARNNTKLGSIDSLLKIHR